METKPWHLVYYPMKRLAEPVINPSFFGYAEVAWRTSQIGFIPVADECKSDSETR